MNRFEYNFLFILVTVKVPDNLTLEKLVDWLTND